MFLCKAVYDSLLDLTAKAVEAVDASGTPEFDRALLKGLCSIGLVVGCCLLSLSRKSVAVIPEVLRVISWW